MLSIIHSILLYSSPFTFNYTPDTNDILGIFVFEMELYVLNLTKLDIEQILNRIIVTPVADLIHRISQDANKVAQELLFKIRTIAARGQILAIGTGDTAIGRTLETLLGIPMNSRQEPDYKGIELKSFRDGRGTRKNLFAKVPDWSLSKFKSSAEILNHFGYSRGTNFQLNCTVSALKINSQGLFLKIDQKNNQLIESSKEQAIGDFAVWQLASLHAQLKTKHRETFWIAADSLSINGIEYFRFKTIEHTRSPITSQFDLLVETGIITLDHQIKRNSTGSLSERGPSFKIKPKKLDLLFPPSLKYSLI